MGTWKWGTDIIPASIIGFSQRGKVEVVGGELWLNGNKTGKSLAAFSPNTWGNITEADVKTKENDYRFRMEPGRCVYLSLSAVGYSNLDSNISSQHICFKRKCYVDLQLYRIGIKNNFQFDYIFERFLNSYLKGCCLT